MDLGYADTVAPQPLHRHQLLVLPASMKPIQRHSSSSSDLDKRLTTATPGVGAAVVAAAAAASNQKVIEPRSTAPPRTQYRYNSNNNDDDDDEPSEGGCSSESSTAGNSGNDHDEDDDDEFSSCTNSNYNDEHDEPYDTAAASSIPTVVLSPLSLSSSSCATKSHLQSIPSPHQVSTTSSSSATTTTTTTTATTANKSPITSSRCRLVRKCTDATTRSQDKYHFHQQDPECSTHSSSIDDSTATKSPQSKKPLHESEELITREVNAQVIEERNRHILWTRLLLASPRGKLTMINLSRRRIGPAEALLLREIILINPLLSVLKLAYNCLGDEGAITIANAIQIGTHHHESLCVLDLGFNEIGDRGCEALALQGISKNYILRSICLSGNQIQTQGALSIAQAFIAGTGITRLYLAGNKIGSCGMKAIAVVIAKRDAVTVSAILENTPCSVNDRANATQGGLEELDVGSTSIGSVGMMAISGLILDNLTLQSLCLTNNNIDDNGVMLLSHSLAQNKGIPLRTLNLSFNQITCQGTESLMNAIWGSPNLREIYLDNNKIQDRGAQLCAVVLTSIALTTLSLAFNRVTTLGIKSLMKNVSENNSLQTLSLSGIPIDFNGSKAISFALAYNNSLQVVYLDSCSTGYSSQRHIVAGIVSNRRSSLRLFSGFSICPVARTLGMPNLPLQWTNEQTLTFLRLMWQQWLLKSGRGVAPSQEDESVRLPAPPAAVAAAAKIALSALGPPGSLGEFFRRKENDNPFAERPPLEPVEFALLERTNSGSFSVPSFTDELDVVNTIDTATKNASLAATNESSFERDSSNGNGSLPMIRCLLDVNPERRSRNLKWMRQHFRSLIDVGRLPFNNADLWQLHQYYFSPPFNGNTDESIPDSSPSVEPLSSSAFLKREDAAMESLSDQFFTKTTNPQDPSIVEAERAEHLERPVSFATLNDFSISSDFLNSHNHPTITTQSNKRRALGECESTSASNKRAKGRNKARIAYYPRLMKKLQHIGARPMEQSLNLLRQLRYCESIIFSGRDPYDDIAMGSRTLSSPSSEQYLLHEDVEMILLDLL